MLLRIALHVNHQVLSRTCMISQKFNIRSMHLSPRIINATVKINQQNQRIRFSPLFCQSFVRYASDDVKSPVNVNISSVSPETSTTVDKNVVGDASSDAASTNLLNNIPDAPVLPDPIISDLASTLSEPTLASLGLGGPSPSGLVQQFLEFVHISMDMPWWASITIGVILMRAVLFPIVIIQQRHVAQMHNVTPGMVKIQEKISDSRAAGDHFETAKYTQELVLYMKENKCHPMKSMLVQLIQTPIFISCFFGLRGMANLPVKSMTEGGLFWFTDLTVSDPYYLVPMLTCGTLWLTIKLGIDTPKLVAMGMMGYGIRALPVIVFPFMINFPVALGWYWFSTNIVSLIQVGCLKIPQVRAFFKIPQQIVHSKEVTKPKPFIKGFKESWSNMRLAREMTDRQQLDSVQFNKAGRGPITKTYSYNPTIYGIKNKHAASGK